jgi:hypothetical protein
VAGDNCDIRKGFGNHLKAILKVRDRFLMQKIPAVRFGARAAF